jgi:large subunit ribosomal protein L9
VTLTFKARVGREGRLYGSITSQDIAAGLRESEGIVIDRRMIDLENPIRATGTFMVPIKIAQKLEPKITVNVIDEAQAGTPETQSVAAE